MAAVAFVVILGVALMLWIAPPPPQPALARNAPDAVAKPLPAVAPIAPPAQPPAPPAAKDPNAIPTSWSEFLASDRKDDKAAVARIQKTDWWKNCVAWGAEARKKTTSRRMWALQANLQATSTINGIDLGGVRGKVPEVGMTTCGAFAVMGMPEDVNRTKTAGSERIQFVWRNPRVYAYTQTSSGDANALIHSVQY